ncbi:glycerol-3-phosphate 1-O-acyltransferase PlsB [Oceanisphaera pacifica]|uniref:Glycerol-3-phosphate acyltransferase n=1 Tax=Oceanisphaera pacifica TaxID=2818389 RepID=A0ABS3NHV1_9GAMM|nr:glycerol-3-phosphate 1-O-acyltransferase PlsB [Oceanisphaera pacifica]MBO1519870.1 glycerol-3-phosphate 1-O-acyltransferase PlsB [Oceanisphaera pacifica]
MIFGSSFARRLLRPMMSVLVNHKSLPADPVAELTINLDQPMVYILKTASISDLLTLELCCAKLKLPSPFSPLIINNTAQPRVICLDKPASLARRTRSATPYLAEFNQLLAAQEQSTPPIQLIPVSLFWGRAPGREGDAASSLSITRSRSPNALRKACIVLLKGRENRVRFSAPLLLPELKERSATDPKLAHKLARIARIHFSRQRLAATGPKLPNRELLLKQLLATEGVVNAIAQHSEQQQQDIALSRRKAQAYMNEIASNFSYPLIRFGDRLLGWLWNKLYRGLSVTGAERVRQLAQDGHELVYLPCHRSHMDYLLLSYVIYHQGMVPPHIAAGINLNFFPAGPIFRRGGAFFIRRTFKDNKLYATVFKEYLNLLFQRGYALEYFAEGGRSRSGRLLPAKPGMLSMTLDAAMHHTKRPITLIPVYLGYEHVMEVSSYHKELQGGSKQKENAWQLFGIIRKLRNFGRGFVNFGEPLPLADWLTQEDNANRSARELTPTLAREVMTRINAAAAVNGLTLSATALLTSDRQALTRQQLQQQIQLYLDYLRRCPYSAQVIIPSQNSEQLLEQALELGKFEQETNSLSEIIYLNRRQSVLLSYYRNNILHLFALPALIATLIERHEGIVSSELLRRLQRLYPLLKAELFLNVSIAELPAQLDTQLAALSQLGLIQFHQQGWWLVPQQQLQLLLLARIIRPSLQRYSVVVACLANTEQTALSSPETSDQEPEVQSSRQQLQTRSQQLAEHLAMLHGIQAPELFDKTLFNMLANALADAGYGYETQTEQEELAQLGCALYPLLPSAVRRSLQG